MLQIRIYLPARDTCGGLPGNSLKNPLRNPLYNNTAHDNQWTVTQLIRLSVGKLATQKKDTVNHTCVHIQCSVNRYTAYTQLHTYPIKIVQYMNIHMQLYRELASHPAKR